MAQTFNRRPYLQDGPRKSDVENHTFDNYKFTGFKEDKNFLEIDQYSFEECNNVYVDNDGLLRSRPSIKVSDAFSEFLEDGETIYAIKNVNDVYFLEIGSAEKIYVIYNDNKITNLTLTDYSLNAVTSYGDRVYYFVTDINTLTNYLKFYDKSSGAYGDAPIYIPETEVQADNTPTKNEPKNALTEKTKTIYLYVSNSYSPFLNGKTIVYHAFGQDFTFVFNDVTRKTILEEKFETTNNAKFYKKNGTLLYFNVTPIIGQSFTTNGQFSFDESTFKDIPSISGVFRGFNITSDGTSLILALDDKIYTCNLLELIWRERVVISLYPRISDWVSVSGDSDVDFHYFYRTTTTDFYLGRFTSSQNYFTIHTFLNNPTATYTIKTYDVDWTTDDPTIYRGLVIIASYGYGNLLTNINGEYCFMVSKYLTGNSNQYSKFVVYTGNNTDTRALLDINYYIDSFCILFLNNNGGDTWETVLLKMDIAGFITDTRIRIYNYNDHGILLNDNSAAIVGSGTHDAILWDLLTDQQYFFTLPVSGWYDAYESICVGDNFVYGVIDYSGKYLLISNNITNVLQLQSQISGDNTIINPNQIEQLNEYYFRVNNKLYISEYREDSDGELAWYLPEINIEEFDGFVTMCPLSSTEMGIFTETGIYIVYRSEQQYEMSTGWKYYPYIQIKSKMDIKIRKGSDVLSTYDGTALIVPTTRGLALMTYQDFVQSTDQKLEFLSDTIYDAFDKYNTSGIKLFRYSYWFFVYKTDNNTLFLLDIRNGSWWPMSGNKLLKSFILYNDKPLLLSNDGKIYVFDKSVDNYKDDDGFIDWYLKSQKLYLGAANYYKHIQNLTFMSHLLGDNDDGYSFKCYLRNTAYRSRISSDAEGKMWEYDIEMIRSYVLRLNYPKVCEFQYELRMNKENTTVDFTPVPLSLSNITVKYRMGGQIR